MSEIHETIEKAQEGEHSQYFNRRIALLIAVLALFLSFSETLGKSAQTEAIAANVESSDLWTFFQAKSIRMTQVNTATEEMLVAAELSRLGFEVMLGNVGGHNSEGYDLAAACPVTGVIAGISVKSLKAENPFFLNPEKVVPKAVYVFVITGPAGQLPQFFVIRGENLLADEPRFWGKYGRNYEPASANGVIPHAG